MPSIDSIETYAYGTSIVLVNEKKRLNVTMINFDDVTK